MFNIFKRKSTVKNSIKPLRWYVEDALARKVAIGHFNISDVEGFWAVVNGAKKLGVPVIIGVSEGERDFIGIDQVKALVDTVREGGQPVFLNADHTYSFDKVKTVIDAGFDSIIYDGTEATFEANVEATKKCVVYARAAAKARGKDGDVLVEAEIGFIGKSSKVLDSIPDGVKISEEFLTKPEDAKKFVDATGVDMLAPAVGNIHGMLKGGKDPALNIALIKRISDAVKIPLVLHGGSGNSAEDFKAAIDAGVAIIHVNTEVRVAYRDALKAGFAKNPDEVAPYKFMKGAVDAMESVVEEKLKTFNKIDQGAIEAVLRTQNEPNLKGDIRNLMKN